MLLISDSRNLIQRLRDLAEVDQLTPESFRAILSRLDGHLAELDGWMDRLPAPAGPPPTRPSTHALPKCNARFHGHLTVFDGGRP